MRRPPAATPPHKQQEVNREDKQAQHVRQPPGEPTGKTARRHRTASAVPHATPDRLIDRAQVTAVALANHQVAHAQHQVMAEPAVVAQAEVVAVVAVAKP